MDVEQITEQLVKLSIEQKELRQKIKALKKELFVHCETNNINDETWSHDNGHVVVTTQVRNKLVEIPVETKISPEVVAIDVAEKAFTSRVVLSKEGKQMLKRQEPSIMKLVIPSKKQVLKIIV